MGLNSNYPEWKNDAPWRRGAFRWACQTTCTWCWAWTPPASGWYGCKCGWILQRRWKEWSHLGTPRRKEVMELDLQTDVNNLRLSVFEYVWKIFLLHSVGLQIVNTPKVLICFLKVVAALWLLTNSSQLLLMLKFCFSQLYFAPHKCWQLALPCAAF